MLTGLKNLGRNYEKGGGRGWRRKEKGYFVQGRDIVSPKGGGAPPRIAFLWWVFEISS